MRKGLLIYDQNDIEKNKQSIAMFQDYAKQIGIDLQLVSSDDEDVLWVEQTSNPEPVVINRSRSYELALEFEKITPFVFNCSTVTLYGNDKFAANAFLAEKGIETIPTYSFDNYPDEFPLIGKTKSGHGGAEVYLVNSAKEAEELIDTFGENIIFQDYIESGNSDLRVYVVGDKILCGMLRSSGSDFRSNFSLGGSAEFVQVPESVKEQVDVVVKALGGVAYCGIDFLKKEDGWIFNEIEDVVGARMVYAGTDLDPIGEFVNYIGKVVGR